MTDKSCASPRVDPSLNAPRQVDLDRGRFQRIVEGQIRKDLKRYLTDESIIGRQQGKVIRVPLRGLGIPRLRHDYNEGGSGVGSGEGKPGDVIGRDHGKDGEGSGEAGTQEEEHVVEAEVTLEKLLQILSEELELPNIQQKTNDSIQTEKWKYTGVCRYGRPGHMIYKRTFRNALKRMMASGEYNPALLPEGTIIAHPDPTSLLIPDVEDVPLIIPIEDDKRFRCAKVRPLPYTQAVMVFMMDVSGSMSDEQKQMVRTGSFWIDQWLQDQYDFVRREYIIFDAAARIVDEHTFYHTREGGGTRVSSSLEVLAQLTEKDYPPENWNVYPFLFSDGDNLLSDDDYLLELIQQQLPAYNQFSYWQVKSMYGSGELLHKIKARFKDEEKVVVYMQNNLEGTRDGLKTFLGKGH